MPRGAVWLILANLTVIAGLAVAFPDQVVSPGKLVDGHQKVQRDCFACHTAFAGTPTSKCTSCHDPERIGRGKSATDGRRDVQARQVDVTFPADGSPAFHSALEDQTCTRCHTDHEGRAASSASGPTFAHDLLADRRREDCRSCHAGPGNDTLHPNTEAGCRTCHETDAWTPASFEHDRLASSAPTECTACHARPEDSLHADSRPTCAVCHGLDAWVPATFRHRHLDGRAQRDCAACHREDEPADALHAVTEGPYCGACHETRAWEPASFEHWRYFPLRGAHEAACDTCHPRNDFKQYSCFGCHAHDRRSVRFEHEEERVSADADCVDCHRRGTDD